MTSPNRHQPAHDWQQHALRPDWPVPANIHALVTTRVGGMSIAPYNSFNLGTHVHDDPAAVSANRALLRAALPSEPIWLEQVHGTAVADAATVPSLQIPVADAAFTTKQNVVCAVLTADCLPVLLARIDDSGVDGSAGANGSAVAVAHAGWRGLCAGVLEETVARLLMTESGAEAGNSKLIAWLGPAIGTAAFEVGDEVRSAFMAHDVQTAAAFQPGNAGKWWCDIYLLARQRLAALGVTQIYGGGLCTVNDAARFFSYRRNKITGRMATLIWMS